mgnify:FL=1
MGIIKNWKLFSNAISVFRNTLVSNRFSVYYSDRDKGRYVFHTVLQVE